MLCCHIVSLFFLAIGLVIELKIQVVKNNDVDIYLIPMSMDEWNDEIRVTSSELFSIEYDRTNVLYFCRQLYENMRFENIENTYKRKKKHRPYDICSL